jgi:ATP-dependent Clp protease ATP-binding subunit ClpA
LYNGLRKGARPLKKLMQKELYDLIARKIIAGELAEDSAIAIDYDGKNILLTDG